MRAYLSTFEKSNTTCSKLQNSDILKDLDKTLLHLNQTQRDELKMLILEYEYFLIFQQGLIKSIMMLMLRGQSQ